MEADSKPLHLHAVYKTVFFYRFTAFRQLFTRSCRLSADLSVPEHKFHTLMPSHKLQAFDLKSSLFF